MRTGGVLGENGVAWSIDHLRKFSRAYAQATEFVGQCYDLLPAAIPTGASPEKAIVLTLLYVRALEFAQSAVLLKRSGLTDPAKSALRGLLESLFVISACAIDEKNVAIFVGQHEHKRLKSINKMIKSSSGSLAFLRERAAQESLEEIRAEASAFPDIKIEEWARRGQRHDLFVTAYVVLSSSAHPTIYNLAEKRLPEVHDAFAIEMRPSDKLTEFILGSAIQFMFDATKVYAEGLNLKLPEDFDRWDGVANELADADEIRAV